MFLDSYFTVVQSLLDEIYKTQKSNMEKAAKVCSECIQNDGIIHVFGCGHSHMLAEEVFDRAGGLVPVNAILEPGLMLHTGARKSSGLERMEGYARLIFNNYNIEPNDVIFVASTSGINPVPIEMAMTASEKGIKVIGITSSSYFDSKSRHKSGKLLYQVVDFYIDNRVPKGDASLSVENTNVKTAPVSTIAGVYILNSVLAQTVEFLAQKGVKPLVYVSGNIEKADDAEDLCLDKYINRLKHL